jgi:amino acid transporter
MPYGSAAVFLAIPTTGIAYAYLGFRQGVDYSGEAKRPTDVVWGTVLGFIIVMAIYVLLQVSFIGGLNFNNLYLVNINTQTNQVVQVIGHPSAGTWNWGYLSSTGVPVSSNVAEFVAYKTSSGYVPVSSGPFYGVLVSSGVGILAAFAIILLIDAVISPSGTG